MNRRGQFVCLAVLVGVCWSAGALTGSGDSATGPLETVAPVFSSLAVDPAQVSPGDTVTITFSVSESLAEEPLVTVGGNAADFVSEEKAGNYTYAYGVQETDVFGMASVEVSGSDALGNPGSLSSALVLEIVEAPPVPLYGWVIFVALLAAGIVAVARRKGVALLALLLVAAPMALAQAPAVSNVAFVQQPDGTGGTEVVITYDLDAPNGPCAITVSLSKNGGADGFIHPVTAVAGDIAGVSTGTGKQVAWDIAMDYPGEEIPNAALRVTADDGLALFTLTYTAGPGGSIDGDSPQEVVEGNDGTQVEAIPNTGYHFVDWSDGFLNATRQDMNVTGDIDVTANFAINTYDITCNVVGNGTCVADPSAVDHGDTSDITVTPAVGWYIDSVVDTEEGSKTGSYTTTPVTANRTVTATFEEEWWSDNLLLNPGNEEDLVGGEIPDWVEVVGTTWQKRDFDPAPFEGGAYFFAGAGAAAELRQDVDVAYLSDHIDTGGLTFSFSGYVRSYAQMPVDTAQVIVEYRDASNASVLGVFDSGPVGITSSWHLLSDSRTAPVGTRFARVRLISVRYDGSNNDGYFDDLALHAGRMGGR